jgi:hypothetical protein
VKVWEVMLAFDALLLLPIIHVLYPLDLAAFQLGDVAILAVTSISFHSLADEAQEYMMKKQNG